MFRATLSVFLWCDGGIVAQSVTPHQADTWEQLLAWALTSLDPAIVSLMRATPRKIDGVHWALDFMPRQAAARMSALWRGTAEDLAQVVTILPENETPSYLFP